VLESRRNSLENRDGVLLDGQVNGDLPRRLQIRKERVVSGTLEGCRTMIEMGRSEDER